VPGETVSSRQVRTAIPGTLLVSDKVRQAAGWRDGSELSCLARRRPHGLARRHPSGEGVDVARHPRLSAVVHRDRSSQHERYARAVQPSRDIPQYVEVRRNHLAGFYARTSPAHRVLFLLIADTRWSSLAITVLPSSVPDEPEAEPEPETDVRIQCRLFREEAGGLADQAYVQRQVPQV
jgi:hypothetical protein